MFPSWLITERERIFDQIGRDQLPHALLIHGPAGSGRRLLALSIVSRLLDLELSDDTAAHGSDMLFDEDLAPAHPDFCLVQPPPEKRVIPIDEIRPLIEFLNLTSHQGGHKVAVINPAQALSKNAADSLLKTLEEPPGSSAIVLITDSLSRLTPTIVSRCQRVRSAIPATEDALEWLDARQENVNWTPVLELAGGAPVKALGYQRTGVPERVAKFEQDIDALERRQTSPVAVAASWGKAKDPGLCLNWLYQRISKEIRVSPHYLRNDDLQNGAENLNFAGSFDELRHIGDLRRLLGSGLNMDLQISAILTRWYGQRTTG